MKSKLKLGEVLFLIMWLALIVVTFTQYGVQTYYKAIIWGLSPIVLIYYVVRLVMSRKHDNRKS